MATFKSYEAVVKEINNRTQKAIELTAKQMQEKLKEIIQEEYYDQYDPILYRPRTYEFLNSAVAKILGKSSASIGIDDAYFEYEYPSKYISQSANENLSNVGQSYVGHWTGEDQVMMASHGYHGNVGIQTDGRFWDEFISWADKNATILLKENLKKCGVPVK